ncbi:MAG: adenosylcobinamide-GDP ribazoletransferase [Chloroflexi bacterium]|nr:adenosylcobinamide-GDP ribazoletransferase [Chloroflexota bacterium]
MALLTAFRFLTAIPLPGHVPASGGMATAVAFFPVVGLAIGLALAAADALLLATLPPAVASALLLLLLLAITGGLHLDGLADTCDGFFHAAIAPARRLEIMRDSRVGGYGVAGVVSLVLVQYSALASLPANLPAEQAGLRASALVLMATLSRWAMSFALGAFPYAHAEGLGAQFRAGLRTSTIVVGTAVTLLICVVIAGALGAALLTAVWSATWLMGKALVARLGGLTGDTYGAINEVVQALVLLALLAAQ